MSALFCFNAFAFFLKEKYSGKRIAISNNGIEPTGGNCSGFSASLSFKSLSSYISFLSFLPRLLMPSFKVQIVFSKLRYPHSPPTIWQYPVTGYPSLSKSYISCIGLWLVEWGHSFGHSVLTNVQITMTPPNESIEQTRFARCTLLSRRINFLHFSIFYVYPDRIRNRVKEAGLTL